MFEKKYTVDSFKPIMDNRTIATDGTWSKYCAKYDVNYSSILTKLIHEAGRWCEYYASDLFISWREIEESLSDPNYNGGVYLFGFRQYGVDHNTFVLSRVNNQQSMQEYMSIYKLTVTAIYDERVIEMKLDRVW